MDTALSETVARIDRHRRREELDEAETLARTAAGAEAVDPVIALGRVLLRGDRHLEAQEQFIRADELAPEDPRPAAWRIAVLARSRRYAEAEAFAADALARHPADPLIRVALGRLYLDRSQVRDAVARFGDAVAVAPESRQALCWLLTGLLAARKRSALAEPARKLEELHGTHAIAQCHLGWVFLPTAPETASLHFEKAIDLDPDLPLGHEWLVTALRILNQYPDAETRIDAAIGLFPNDSGLRIERALLLNDLGKHQEAITAVDELLAMRPRYARALRHRVSFLADAHRWEDAERAGRAALEMWPDDPDIATALASTLHSQGRYDDALVFADQALGTEPADEWALLARITTLQDARRYREAEETATAALTVSPDSPNLLTGYAWVRCQQGDLGDALDAMERAVAGELPGDWALRSRVSLFQAANERAAAVAAAIAGLEHLPHDMALHGDYVWALYRDNRVDEAVHAAQQVAERYPWSITAQCAQVQILRQARRYDEAAIAAIAALSRHPDNTELRVEHAWTLSMQDREEAAIAAVEQALSIDPADPVALQARASFLNYACRFAEAEQAAADAIKLKGDDATLHQVLANARFNQGRVQEGIDTIRAGLERLPDDLTLVRAHAGLLRQVRRYDEAEQALAGTLEAHPEDASLLTELAWVRSGQERPVAALEIIERALAMDPNSEWALRGRTRFLAEAGRIDEALDAAKNAEERLPGQPDLVIERGWLLHEQRRYDGALEAGREALRLAPQNPWALRSLVSFLTSARRLPEAEQEARRAADLVPLSPDLRYELAWTVSRQDREEEAIAIIDELLEAHPGNAPALSARIEFLGYARRFDDQLAAVEHALEQQPDDPDTLLAAAWAHSTCDRHDAAIALAERALEQVPGDLVALRGLVGLLAAADRVTETERVAAQLLGRSTDDAVALLGLAQLAGRRDHHEKALGLLDRAQKADPLHLGVRIQRVRTLLRLQQPGQAEEAARQALTDWPGHPSPLIELARVLDHRGEVAPAVDHLADAIGRDPGDLSLRAAYSGVLRSARRFDEAEREIAPLARTYPHYLDLRIELGWIQHDDRRLDEARRTFTILVEEAANNEERAVAHHGRGWVEFADGNYAEAETEFRTALANRPDDFEDQLGLAWSLTRQRGIDNYRRATDLAIELARRVPDPSVYVCLGVLAFAAARPASAEHYFRRSLAISEHHGSHTDLGALYAQLGRFDDAERHLTAAISRDWYDAVAHIELGSLLLDTKTDRLAEAEREFRQALAADSSAAAAAIGLAQVLTKTGEEAEAESTLRSALKHQTGSQRWQTHLALARLLVQRGDKQQNSDLHAEAYAEAQRAIGLAPDDEAEPHFVAGVAHHRMGSLAADARGRFGYRRRAMNHLRACLERSPGHADAQRNKLLLEREMRATAPAVWGGYAVATISVLLLGVEWVTFYLTDKVTVLMVTTTTPVLVGLFTIAVLLPALIRLKLPGFEADLQAGTASITPGPMGQVVFSPRFTVTTGPTGQLPRHNAGSATRTVK